MFQCSNVPEHFRCRCGGEIFNERRKTKDNFSNFIYHLKESRIYYYN